MRILSAMLPAFFLAACATAPSGAPVDPRPWGPSEKGWATIDGELLPETSFRKSHGAFCAQLLLVSDPTFFKRWDQPSQIFEFDGVERIERGVWFVAIVLFANPSIDAEGDPELTIDMQIVRPDGTVMGRIRDANAWEGPPLTDDFRGKLGLATQYIRVRVEDSDPLGHYRIEATLTDAPEDVSLTMKRTVLIDAKSAN